MIVSFYLANAFNYAPASLIVTNHDSMIINKNIKLW